MVLNTESNKEHWSKDLLEELKKYTNFTEYTDTEYVTVCNICKNIVNTILELDKTNSSINTINKLVLQPLPIVYKDEVIYGLIEHTDNNYILDKDMNMIEYKDEIDPSLTIDNKKEDMNKVNIVIDKLSLYGNNVLVEKVFDLKEIEYIIATKPNEVFTSNEDYRYNIDNYTMLLNTLEEAIDLESDIDTDISNVESIMSNNEDITESMIIDLKDRLDNYNNILNLEFSNINLEGFDKLYSKETYRELYNNLKSAKYNITKLSYIVSERVKAYSLSFRNMLDRTFKTDINSALELKSKLEECTVDSIDATRFTKKYSKYSGDSNFYYDGTNPLIEDLSNNILNYLTNIRTRDFNSTSGYRSIDYKLKSDNDFDNSTLIGVTVTKNLIKGIYVLTGDEYVNIVVRKSHTIKDYSGKFIFTRKMALKLLNSLIEYRKEYFKFRDKQDSLIKDVARLKNLPEGIDYVKFYSTYTKNHNILLKALYSQFKEFNRFALLYASYYIKASNQMDIKGEDDEY